MKRILTLILSVLLACVTLSARAHADTFAIYQATWNPPAGSAEAQQWGIVPRSAFAPEVKDCYWTGSNTAVWAVPPTTQQVQTAAKISTIGGANPYGAASGQ